jgi:hypothetical protein
MFIFASEQERWYFFLVRKPVTDKYLLMTDKSKIGRNEVFFCLWMNRVRQGDGVCIHSIVLIILTLKCKI